MLFVRNIGSETLQRRLVQISSIVKVCQVWLNPMRALRGSGRHFAVRIAYADWYVIEFGVSISKVRSPCVWFKAVYGSQLFRVAFVKGFYKETERG